MQKKGLAVSDIFFQTADTEQKKKERKKEMAKRCPMSGDLVLYTQCLECENRGNCREERREAKEGQGRETFALLVVGSRTVNDYAYVREKLDALTKEAARKYEMLIVSGGAGGADTLAERYAREKGYKFLCIRADWKKYGKKAGYIRNRQMHEHIAKYEHRGCVAFWDGSSRGTAQSIPLSSEFGTPLRLLPAGPDR